MNIIQLKTSDLSVLYPKTLAFEMHILKEMQGQDGCEYRKLFVHNQVR